MPFALLFLLLALVLFILDGFRVTNSKWDLQSLGLASFVLAIMLGAGIEYLRV